MSTVLFHVTEVESLYLSILGVLFLQTEILRVILLVQQLHQHEATKSNAGISGLQKRYYCKLEWTGQHEVLYPAIL